jgi:hypothetical protein
MVRACDASDLALAIDAWHARWCRDPRAMTGCAFPEAISSFTWERIRARYVTEVFA